MATSVAAPQAPRSKPILLIRGFPYPVLLPTLRDPRLHLAAVIISLQILGQTAFDFSLSIAQILMALATCAVLETAIAFRQQRVIMWPASALLTGNGVAFVLRVPGTHHGDWWSTRGWWIFVGTAAVSLLSKYVVKWRGDHIFNPSNFGLVLCFLVLGSSRADPLDFWWGPMTPWMALATGIIVAGGLAILLRLKLIGIAIGFWLAFVAGIGVIALSGHSMTARWHLGPVTGRYFWWVLITSPEILVFLFFMITDPKTIPKGRVARIVHGVAIGVLATLLIAPQRTEFGAKVAVLGALAIVCFVRPLLDWLLPAAGSPDDRLWAWIRRAALRGRAGLPKLATASLAGAGAFVGLLVVAGLPARPATIPPPLAGTGRLPQITILHSSGVSTQIDRKTARQIARSLVVDLRRQERALLTRNPGDQSRGICCDAYARLQRQVGAATGGSIAVPAYRLDTMRVHLRPAEGQGEPIVVAQVTGLVQTSRYQGRPARLVKRGRPVKFSGTFQMDQGGPGYELITFGAAPVAPKAVRSKAQLLVAKSFDGVRLQDVASKVGIDFQQDDFHHSTNVSDVQSMMGGGLCWLDYNNDGWLDLFAVNSYSDADRAYWQAHGGLPTSHLYENVHGHFVDVTKRAHLNIPMQGNGCVPIDLGNGYPSLFITTNTYNVLLRNNGNGTFTNVTHQAGIDAFGTFGWHTGAAVADVNGDGRPDIFVSGYADVNAPVDSAKGFPQNYQAFPDLLYLNEGNGKFQNVAQQVGIDRAGTDHSLGAVFTDVNRDGRPDLYVANDLDPNRLYMNVKSGPPLWFRFVEEGTQWRVADRNAGMGIASADVNGDLHPDLFVTNSRGQGHAAFMSTDAQFTNAQPTFARALGTNGTGWGDSWVDLANNGRFDLVLDNGDIPVTNLKTDAGSIQVLENLGRGRFADASKAVGLDPGPLVNGRGLAVADYDNDGRMDVAINSIGGKLILLHNTGPTGHWLEVRLDKLIPGAIVTAALPNATVSREVQTGGSYLSSEDPRIHFGLGKLTTVPELVVDLPNGREIDLRNVRADQILTVKTG